MWLNRSKSRTTQTIEQNIFSAKAQLWKFDNHYYDLKLRRENAIFDCKRFVKRKHKTKQKNVPTLNFMPFFSLIKCERGTCVYIQAFILMINTLAHYYYQTKWYYLRISMRFMQAVRSHTNPSTSSISYSIANGMNGCKEKQKKKNIHKKQIFAFLYLKMMERKRSFLLQCNECIVGFNAPHMFAIP